MTETSSVVDFIGVATSAMALGHIVRITPEDIPVVDYYGNPTGPLEARIATDPPAECSGNWPPVLLAFENGDPTLPVIVGFVRRTMKAGPRQWESRRVRKLVLGAEEEILLRCGKSSVLLRRDGKIVIKGGDILSRASGTNKVQGGTIRLN
jgi:hypothetical protein